MNKLTIIILLLCIIGLGAGEVYILKEFTNIYELTVARIDKIDNQINKVNDCPLKFEDVCYPISAITSISCGESAAKAGLFECEILFKSNVAKE